MQVFVPTCPQAVVLSTTQRIADDLVPSRSDHRRVTILRDSRILAELFDRYGPVIAAADADAAGVPRALLRRGSDNGVLLRVAKSAFVMRERTRRLTEWEVFRLRSIGFGLCHGPNVYLTGWAAAAVLGVPTVHTPPSYPTGLRPGSAHRAPDRTPYGRIRWGFLPSYHRTSRSRVQSVDVAYAALDIARHNGAIAGTVAADFALSVGIRRDELAALTDDMVNYPGIQTARWVVEHADGRAESPLETLGRLAFLTGRRDPPLSNVWITAGRRHYRVDHFLPSTGVVIEGDGALKYNNRPDAGKVLMKEKDRERDLRLLGLEIVRYDFDTVMRRPGELLRRVDAAQRSSRGRPAPDCWSMDAPDLRQQYSA